MCLNFDVKCFEKYSFFLWNATSKYKQSFDKNLMTKNKLLKTRATLHRVLQSVLAIIPQMSKKTSAMEYILSKAALALTTNVFLSKLSEIVKNSYLK